MHLKFLLPFSELPILRGASAPSQVDFGTPAENSVDSPATYVFGEGAKDNTRGACSPHQKISTLTTRYKLSKIVFGLLALVFSSSAFAASIDEANKLFQAGDFPGAANAYQKVIDTEGPSAAVLYNLGNSRYRLGQYGPAILAYERAKLLAPRDPDLQANLNLARKAATVFDKSALDPRLEAVVGYLSLNEWSWLVAGAALWTGVLSVATGLVRIPSPAARRLALGSIVFSGVLIAAGTAALVLRRDEAGRGIVLSKDSAILLSPFEKAETVGTPGAGRIVRMGTKNGGYFYVDVPGTELHGWMLETDVAAIAPGSGISTPLARGN